MLSEVRNARQIKDEGSRRWFTSRNFDLIIWYNDDGKLEGFQLCYNKQKSERAFTWYADGRSSHLKVDDGEGNKAFIKMTPVLVPDGIFNKDLVLHQFSMECTDIDPEISRLVIEKIKQYH